MKAYTEDEFRANEDELLRAVAQGAVYIHPTDTIYGVGCDATNPDAVKRVRDAKQQHEQPFSIIAPSKQWIRDHCELSPEAEKWLEKMPGSYTLILKLKKKTIAPEVLAGKETIGVRMPDHWIQDISLALNRPLVTTSANLHGKAFMTSLEDLDPELEHKIDFAINEGPKQGRPSTIVDLTGEAKVVERQENKKKLLSRMLEHGKTAVRKMAGAMRFRRKNNGP